MNARPMDDAEKSIRRTLFVKGVLALLGSLALLFVGLKLGALIFPQEHRSRMDMGYLMALFAVCVAVQTWGLRVMGRSRGQGWSLFGSGVLVVMALGVFVWVICLTFLAVNLVYFFNPTYGPLFGGR